MSLGNLDLNQGRSPNFRALLKTLSSMATIGASEERTGIFDVQSSGGAAETRTHQTEPAWALGDDDRAELSLRSLNRLIKEDDLNMIYVVGPGHGRPGLVAQTYLEGSNTERDPAIERSASGLRCLF